MKVVSLAVTLVGVAASALAADLTSSSSTASAIKQAVPIGEKFVANKYILQFDHESELPNNKRDASVHETVYASLTRRRVRFRVHKEYKHEGLFVGAAVVLDSADDYDALETTPGVTGVFPVRLLKVMEPITKALGINATAPQDTTSTHVSTGVDKLHAEGKLGAGIKIGIIDTGVDYRHPSLGGGYGKGFKVAGGYDHVGDEYDGSADPIADNDPLDECVGHGTHVAGIIGADNNNVFNLTGVAPKATLYAYRVFSCYGVSDDSIIVDAMLRAYADGMDVITMSLGATVGFSNYVTGDVASKLADRGKIVTAAAGNSGEVGNWYTSSPAAAKSVISVASTDNTAAPAQKALVSGVDRKQVVYFGLAPLPITGSHPVYATSLNTSVTYDACDPLPDDTPDLSNYVVLIRRGECALYTKMMNAVEKGAQYIMIYNNVPGLEELSWDPEYIIQLMTPEDGEYLVNQLAAGKTPTLSFPQTDSYVEYANAAGGLVSYYSSMGPSFDMLMSPSIAAPGGNILSTWMTNDGSWAILSGTSMATPFMAGVAALLFEAKGKTAAVGRSARDLFQTTARPLKSTHAEDSLLNTISVQGAGLINAYDVIKTTTIVSPGQFALNDTEHIQKIQVFTITNKSNKIKIYKIGHVPAATVLTVEADTNDTQNPPVPEVATAAKVTFGLNTVILLPGLSLPVFATFTPPKGLDAHRLPVYSGWITITSGDEVQRISYMGVAASLRKDKTVINNPLLLSGAGGIVREPTNFTFVDGDAPLHLLRLTFGTPLLQIDLVPADTKFVPTLPKRTLVKATKTVGRLNTFTYVNRNVATAFGDGLFYIIEMESPVFENGTRIPKGQYKILGRTLKVFGDPKVEEDHESWLSPVIGFP